ncbi:hypothetical protein [Roseateles amylovorans]|uniref:Uncharacterized protein n=1 Tax=Roseateles amylovorans TaxID=2978473 RepID=A0ABY6ATP5_9BURK|nr:hypothetical protein [Roseateles amylovorans]UXH76298.1 hypothetical protein N4261_14625 [Roseateles amylovorans]
MAPTSVAGGADLQIALGFLQGLSLDEATTTAAAQPQARVVRPMTGEQIQALQRQTEAFVRGPEGRALIEEICADLGRLVTFAERESLGGAGRELRDLCERLPQDRAAPDYWLELFTDGRIHLARVVQAIEDPCIPLEDRRAALGELSTALTNCGLRLRVEFARAERALIGYRGNLRHTVRRMFDESRDDVIRQVMTQRMRREGDHHRIDVHELESLHHALGIAASRQNTGVWDRPAFKDHVKACRRALMAQVTPNTVARLLAEECLHAVRAGLQARVREPLNLGENHRHMALLSMLVKDLSVHYGPLRDTSFIELNDDALPELIDDPALIALDIRRGMVSHGIAGPAESRELLVLGQGDTRLAIHAMDHHLCHAQVGDPALDERHPIRQAHLDAIVSAGNLDWRAEAQAPRRWPATFLTPLLETSLAQMDDPSLLQVSPNWMADPDTARRFGARLSDPALHAWMAGCETSDLSETGLRALMTVIAARPEPTAAIQALARCAPQVPPSLWRSLGSEWLETGLTMAQAPLTRAMLELLRACAAQLSPDERAAGLTLPFSATGENDVASAFIGHYLDLLVDLGEQALLTPSQTAALLRNDGPVARALSNAFLRNKPLMPLLDALTRLCRSGTLDQDHLIALMNTAPQQSGSVPYVVQAIRTEGGLAINPFIDWVLSSAGRDISVETARRLLAPEIPPGVLSVILRGVRVDDGYLPLLDYLNGLMKAREQGLVRDADVTQVLFAWMAGDNNSQEPLFVYLLHRRGQHACLALLDWLRTAVHAGVIDRNGLLRLLDEPDTAGWAVMGTALIADFQASVLHCMAVLDAAMARGLIDAPTLAEVIQHAVNRRQNAATTLHVPRQSFDLGIRLVHPESRPHLHALDVLWETLLPMIAEGRFAPSLLTNLLTQRDPHQPHLSPTPTAILLGAYQRLTAAIFRWRAPSGGAAKGGSSAGARLPDPWVMTLLECRSGPGRRPALCVALQGGAHRLVAQLMEMAVDHLRSGRLTLPDLVQWWQATGDDAMPAVQVAIASNDPDTLRIFIDQLLAAFDPSLRFGGRHVTRTAPHEAQHMLTALLGATHLGAETPSQAAVRHGDPRMLAVYLDGVFKARQLTLISHEALAALIAPAAPQSPAPLPPPTERQAECLALLRQRRQLAQSLGWLQPG